MIKAVLMSTVFLFSLYIGRGDCKLNENNVGADIVEKNLVLRGLNHLNKGDNIINIDASAVSGLSGNITVNFNLVSKDCMYFEFSMEDVSIDKAIIDDIDISCDTRKTQINGRTSFTIGLYSTRESPYYRKETKDMSNAEWKLIKLERISNIKESVHILEFTTDFYESGEMVMLFDITKSNNDKLKVKFEIPMTPIPVSE